VNVEIRHNKALHQMLHCHINVLNTCHHLTDAPRDYLVMVRGYWHFSEKFLIFFPDTVDLQVREGQLPCAIS